MLHVLLISALFNIYTGDVHDYKTVKIYPGGEWTRCAKDLNNTGPQKPDKNGDVKIFQCLREGDKPTVTFIEDL